MSHFTVLVIGENPEQQLQPYHEYECTGIEDEYVKFVEAEEDIKKEYKEHKKDYASIDEFAKDYYGYYKENGKYGRRTNPNSKWDWYQLGGRWAGQFKIKEGAKFEKPNFSWVWDADSKQEVLSERRADTAIKKDIENIDEIVTFALIKDGKWYERGEMGWWGIAINEKDEDAWDKEFKALIKNIPDDTLLSIYDCHI